MKCFIPFLVVLVPVSLAFAGESALTKTYQPLEGLGRVKIHIVEVTCHDWDVCGRMPLLNTAEPAWHCVPFSPCFPPS